MTFFVIEHFAASDFAPAHVRTVQRSETKGGATRIANTLTRKDEERRARQAKQGYKIEARHYGVISHADYAANLDKLDPMTTTRNMLNPNGGDIPIRSSAKGGCCDPGTERYHCM